MDPACGTLSGVTPSILYDDDDLFAVDKPAGLVVHPTYRNREGTLLDALPPGSRVVTRLDKLTSGVVVVAKDARAHAALQRALASPDAEKLYLAIVRGAPPAAGIVDAPLAHDPSDRRRRIVSAGGAASVTEFETIERGRGQCGEAALLRCRLRTGRRHQVRVHLASRGWPILGDAVYGGAVDGMTRHALHAWRVSFVHPATRMRVTIEAPAPQDFCSLLYSCFAETSSGMSASAFFQFAKNRS